MGKKYFIGVDVGTTAVKTMIIDDTGEEIAVERKEHKVYQPHDSWSEESPDEWWSGFLSTSKKAAYHLGINLNKVSGIGISNLCTSLVVLSSKGKPLFPAIIWDDRRSIKQANLLNKLYEEKKLISKLGKIKSGETSITSLLWLIQNKSKLMEKAWKFMHANGYIGFKLTGIASIDPSNASRTGLFEKNINSWNKSIINNLGIEKIIPNYSLSHEIIGRVSDKASKETGLARGTIVVAGGADSACAALGAGVTEFGQVLESTGGTGVIATHFPYNIDDVRLRSRSSVIPEMWMIGSGTSGTGLSLQWARDKLGFADIIHSKNPFLNVYEEIDKWASQSTVGAKGIIFIPYQGGKRTIAPNSEAKGAIIGLNFSHDKKDIMRSILEGTIFELREILETIKDIGCPIKEIRSVGGGAKSDIWRQIRSDIFGYPIYVPLISESSSLGAAMLAAIGEGYFKDFREAINWVKLQSKFSEPNFKNHKKYIESYSLFQDYYKKLFK